MSSAERPDRKQAPEPGPSACLTVIGLHVTYPGGGRAVRGVDLTIRRGSTVALVGESGCGKSTLADTLVGLLPRGTTVAGRIVLEPGEPDATASIDLLQLSPKARRALRGTRIGYVTQDPFAAFDPVRTVGHHVTAAWRVHGRRPGLGQVSHRLRDLGITRPEVRAGLRPHQWSGGMLQRASIAAAGALGPDLVVADEPTSALDADLAFSTLSALRTDARSMLLITHNLPLAARIADEVHVLYAGRIVEHGPAPQVCQAPAHPYTRALLAATPRGRTLPTPLPGSPPTPHEEPSGCDFAARCPLADDVCTVVRPQLFTDERTFVGTACHRVQR